jgi:DNA-binding NtrC family response regulator
VDPLPETTGTQPLDLGEPVTVTTLAALVSEGPDDGRRVEAPEDRLTIGSARSNHLVMSDPTVSRFHLELVNGPRGVWVRDLSSLNGTWLGEAAIERARVPIGSELRLGRSRLRILDGSEKTVDAHESLVLHGLFGADRSMRRLMGTLRRVAPTNAGVLVTGESGTGKELVARALHAQSERAKRPFVVVDCGALTPTLMQSALFGHERGAFTGAERKHIGAFERADGGTVFLDEIGELPLELQPQLLGVLERKHFLPLGGTREVDVDVRVVAATNRDLRGEVNRGTFREDLYYRLAVVTLNVPPLRERISDLPLLAEHFLREAGSNAPFAEVFPERVLSQMNRHNWPGNVRELGNFVEALLIVGEPELVRAAAQPGSEPVSLDDSILAMRYADARSVVLAAFERHYLSHLLTTSRGNVSGAARAASMDRSYLIRLLEKHGLK